MREAETAHARERNVPVGPTKKGVSGGEIDDLRHEVREAMHGFLVRCRKEGLFTEDAVRGVADRLGIGVAAEDVRGCGRRAEADGRGGRQGSGFLVTGES